MEREEINIVWLKRDIRSQDHESFKAAELDGTPFLIIYVFDSQLIAYKDTSLRHLQFQYHSINSLNGILALYNKKIEIFFGDSLEILQWLQSQFLIKKIFSYQESGVQLSFERDIKLKAYFSSKNINWKEFQKDGVLRGINNRIDWDQKWYQHMCTPMINNDHSYGKTIAVNHEFNIPQNLLVELSNYPKQYQPPGERNGIKYLATFIDGRGKNYSRHISKPSESRLSCSRLSPYLAWGNISVRQAYQVMYAAAGKVSYKSAILNAITRLKWRDHFIQKFEVQCNYETQCLNPQYEKMEWQQNEAHIKAWEQGKTGLPLVDACMRCVQQTGWINFRMRAMVLSFFSHHLFQDWRHGVYFLAQNFLDYEPGIHYPQFQMQAGTTGINTVRIYNPVKQSQDHDPEGVFIKRWIPELSLVPTKYIHEPWNMPPLEAQMYGFIIGETYPAPIINLESDIKKNREAIWTYKKSKAVKNNNNKILELHARPNPKP